MTAKQENTFYKKKLALLEFMAKEAANTGNEFDANKHLYNFRIGKICFTETYNKIYHLMY